jgi:prophage tail gpP-like protein
MPRPVDTLTIERLDSGGNQTGNLFDNFTSFSLSNDITSPSEANFEVGNDGTFAEISSQIAIGTQYRIFLNGAPRLTGRIEFNDVPTDAGGSVVRFNVRTKLADAHFASADPSIGVKKTSVKDFILALYAPMGLTEDDFYFKGNLARDLLTGQSSNGQGSPTEIDLEPIKVDAARVQSSETIYAAADRHLRRHGYMHWDAPDGKIVVTAPNDTQKAIYFFRLLRGERGRENNVEAVTRTIDYSDIPSKVAVFGRSSGRPRKRLKSEVEDSVLTKAGFYRPVVVPAEGLKIQSAVDRAAAREMAARSKQKDCWNIEIDGLSYWDGRYNIPMGVDTVCEFETDVSGGALGAYYIHRVTHRRDAMSGDVTNISALAKGIWVL